MRSEADFERRMNAAAKRVAEMDIVDDWRDRQPATMLAALECGLRRPHTDAHFDAFIMLQEHFGFATRVGPKATR